MNPTTYGYGQLSQAQSAHQSYLAEASKVKLPDLEEIAEMVRSCFESLRNINNETHDLADRLFGAEAAKTGESSPSPPRPAAKIDMVLDLLRDLNSEIARAKHAEKRLSRLG